MNETILSTILLLDPCFKINGWIYKGILGVLVKNFIKLHSIPFYSSQFWGNENLKFWRNREEWVFHLYPFYSLSLKLPNKRMDFIKTPEQGKERNILKLFFLFNTIPFHSFPPPKRGLRLCYLCMWHSSWSLLVLGVWDKFHYPTGA